MLVSGTTYRYWTKGAPQSGDSVVLHFVDNKWQYRDASGNVTPNSGQPDFTLPSIATLSRHYIDVNLTPAGSHTVNAGTVDGGEISLSAAGVTVLATSDAKPTNIKGTIYRYYLSGDFTAARPCHRHIHRRHVAGLRRRVERRLQRLLHDRRSVCLCLRSVHGRQHRRRRCERRA